MVAQLIEILYFAKRGLKMEKFVEINSSGEVVLDKDIISILKPKGTRLKCVFDRSKIILIPGESQDYVARAVARPKDITATTSDKVFASLTDDFVLRSLEATLKKLELEHKERVCQGNLREEFEQLVQRGKELIAQSSMEWREPEEVVREMRERREMNIMESLGYEK